MSEKLTRPTHLYYIITILVLIVIILSISTCNGNRKASELNGVIYALNDTMQTYRNRDGAHVAKITILETQNVTDFLLLTSKDSTINKLQNEVSRYRSKISGGGSVTVINTNTNAAGASGNSITKYDTVIKDNFVYIYP